MSTNEPSFPTERAETYDARFVLLSLKVKTKTNMATDPKKQRPPTLRPTMHKTDKPPTDYKGDPADGAAFYWCPRCRELWGVVWTDDPKIRYGIHYLASYKKWATKTLCEACMNDWVKCEESEDWEML